MNIKLGKNFKKSFAGEFGKYDFEVGILDDAPHKDAKRGARGLKGTDNKSSYAGGPIRKKGTASSMTNSDILAANSARLGFNILTHPFEQKSSDIMKFTKGFLNLVFGIGQKRRVENLLQAIVRNPILRGEYGPQSALTTVIKGFDRPMIDTAQLFKAIKARCTVRGKV